jgi:hypothetical protein
MVSKKPLLVGLLFSGMLIGILLMNSRTAFERAFQTEWLENTLPEQLDEETLLPFGYTLAVWPKAFEGEPIVTRLTYQKGPPSQFISSMVQIWRPIEVELTLHGPRTLVTNQSADAWRICFQSGFSCKSEKLKMKALILPDEKEHGDHQKVWTWFDGLDPLSPRGVHLLIDAGTYRIDRYAIITPAGATQMFSLKTAANPIGSAGRSLFQKTLSTMKVKDDLASNRAWIQNRIKTVSVKDIRSLPDQKARLEKLIRVQNWIFSHLSVDPSQLPPYFHLAGTTHLLALELLRTKERIFETQEAWILGVMPLMRSLIAYAKDFKDSEPEVKNMEALLQDILVEQQRLTR